MKFYHLVQFRSIFNTLYSFKITNTCGKPLEYRYKYYALIVYGIMKKTKNIYIQKANLPKHQNGVGMIEVLITLVILAIGLLGVASLQFIGSFANKEALARTQAVMVTQQMTERLRAGTVASQVTDGFVVHNNYFDDANYNFGNLTCNSSAPPYECHCLTIPATIPNCQTNDCEASDLAIFDAYQMSCSMVRENPNATITVSCDDTNTTDLDTCTAGSIHNIMVKWPSQNWRDDFKKANTNCNENSDSDFDCVVKEVTL
jgi:type IV pilus assembly protein PilV